MTHLQNRSIVKVMKREHVIIFIPGFKGSTLVNQGGGLIWPNFIKAQFNHTISLNNNLPSLNIENSYIYESNDIVKSVSVFPGLFNYNVYGKFTTSLQKALPSQTKLIFFHYDWRQDLLLTIDRLRTLIEQTSRDKTVQIDIICHSMGGLITTYMMHMIGANIIRQIYFVGVPFQGALRALLDLMKGTKLGLNKTLLSARAMSTFSSLYYLLPRYPEAVHQHSIFDIETWKKFNIGYLTNEDNKLQLEFLEAQLNKVSSFYKKIESAESKICEPQKLIFINNLTHPTPTQIKFGPKAKVVSNLGDGTVPSASLQIPDYFKPFNHEIYYIDKSHALSFSSDKLLKIILENLTES